MCLGVVVIFVDGALLGLRANHENIQKPDIFLSHDEPMGTADTLYGVLKRLADLLQLRSQVIERNVGGIHIEIQRLIHD